VNPYSYFVVNAHDEGSVTPVEQNAPVNAVLSADIQVGSISRTKKQTFDLFMLFILFVVKNIFSW